MALNSMSDSNEPSLLNLSKKNFYVDFVININKIKKSGYMQENLEYDKLF